MSQWVWLTFIINLNISRHRPKSFLISFSIHVFPLFFPPAMASKENAHSWLAFLHFSFPLAFWLFVFGYFRQSRYGSVGHISDTIECLPQSFFLFSREIPKTKKTGQLSFLSPRTFHVRVKRAIRILPSFAKCSFRSSIAISRAQAWLLSACDSKGSSFPAL